MSRAKEDKPAARPRADESPVARSAIAGSPECERWAAAMAKWADGGGGPLPWRMAAHVGGCPPCADRVRRFNRVNAALTMIKSETMPGALPVLAGGRALKMLMRAARASAQARAMLRLRPDLTVWQRAGIHATRISSGAVAAGLLMVMRLGLLGGFEQTRTLAQTLADEHWAHHIDPQGEWLDRGDRPMA